MNETETITRLTPRQQRMFAEQQHKLAEKKRMQSETVQTTEEELPVVPFQTLESVYESLDATSNQGQEARELVFLRDWFTSICRFDPLTCEPEPMGTDELLQKIRRYNHNEIQMLDNFGRILEHSLEALKNILLELRTQIFREHKVLPIYAVREVDSKSIQWLSRKTGRSIREKLSGNPYILAVNKRMSANTAENRLLKVFVLRLEQLLLTRQEIASRLKNNAITGFHFEDKYVDDIDDILGLIRLWYDSENYDEIGEWKNPPPNNTLLSNRNYRKILDSWNWLNTIDEEIQREHQRLNQNVTKMIVWRILAELSALKNVRLLQFPVQPDYDDFAFSVDLTGVIGVNITTNENIYLNIGNDNIIFRCGQQEKVFPLNSKLKTSAVSQNSDQIISEHVKQLLEITEIRTRKQIIELTNLSGKRAVIDLCSIRPSLIVDKDKEINLPFRFTCSTLCNKRRRTIAGLQKFRRCYVTEKQHNNRNVRIVSQ